MRARARVRVRVGVGPNPNLHDREVVGWVAEDRINLNVCSNDEHVGEIERMIRTIKERARGIYNTLVAVGIKKLPGRLVVELIYTVVFWLNTFHPSPSIVPNMSPRAIITGQTIDFNKHCKYEFGEYVHTHEQHTNNMTPRTVGALALRPTGNQQEGTTS